MWSTPFDVVSSSSRRQREDVGQEVFAYGFNGHSYEGRERPFKHCFERTLSRPLVELLFQILHARHS